MSSSSTAPLTSFGPNNTVTVETALVLRRITSADTETIRPATVAQLATRQSLLPRTTHSAEVIRSRNQLDVIQKQCVSATERNKKAETKFTSSLPLVHLGVKLQTTTNADDYQPRRHSTPRESKRTDNGIATVVDGFYAAREAATAMNAVENLPAHVIRRNPYLQHVRDSAEGKLRRIADTLVHMTSDGPYSPSVSDDDEPLHNKALFEEWNAFLRVCEPDGATLAEANINPETQKELFIAFVRSRGSLSPPPQTASVEDEHPQPQTLVGSNSRRPEPLDDVVAPSQQSGIVSTPLKKPKMMLAANEKLELLDRLVEQAVLGDSPRNGLSSPQLRVSDTVVEARAREAMKLISNANVETFRTNVERQQLRHQQSGMRLHRRRNLDLYRQQQREQHQLGLLRRLEASLAKSANVKVLEATDSSFGRRSTVEVFGPPAATHKLKSRGSSAKSRPSSSSSLPQVVIVADLPTVTTHKLNVSK